MLNVVLYEPEIPPNTGNVIRLCANTGSTLHLIKPLGFSLDEKRLRRAGLDYREWMDLIVHESYDAFINTKQAGRLIACSTKGTTPYHQFEYQPQDYLLFGPETRGLPTAILNCVTEENIVRIPMMSNSRSLNLSNAVAVILFEGLRQHRFEGLV